MLVIITMQHATSCALVFWGGINVVVSSLSRHCHYHWAYSFQTSFFRPWAIAIIVIVIVVMMRMRISSSTIPLTHGIIVHVSIFNRFIVLPSFLQEFCTFKSATGSFSASVACPYIVHNAQRLEQLVGSDR